jgi:hypothetical protein
VGFDLVGNSGALTRPNVMPILRAANPIYGWSANNLEHGMGIHQPAHSRGREFTDAAARASAFPGCLQRDDRPPRAAN